VRYDWWRALTNNHPGLGALLGEASEEEAAWAAEVRSRTLAVTTFEALQVPEGKYVELARRTVYHRRASGIRGRRGVG
jgi:hypothetical protein